MYSVKWTHFTINPLKDDHLTYQCVKEQTMWVFFK